MKALLRFLGLVILLFVGGVVVSYFLSGQPTINTDTLLNCAKSTYTIAFVAVGILLWFLYKLSKFGDDKTKAGTSSKTKQGKELSQYYDSRWITEKELKTKKEFMYCTWDTLGSQKDGMLLRSELVGNKLNINMYKPIHAMVIGTTGTGKTERFINPSIQILSGTKTKPCFVITDPKGELYEKNSHRLRSQGYEVKTFNLRQPYSSTRWNPLDNAYMMYQEAHHLNEKVIVHNNVNPSNFPNLRIISNTYNNEWYEFNKIAYPNKETLEMDLSSKKAELIDLAENELREIAQVLCPIENKNDSSWDRGAQEFVCGTLLAMLEDSLDPELGMTRERFNFYNLARIANYKDPDPDNPYKTLRQYYQGRSQFSKVMQLVTTAINNAPTTTKSYMGIVSARLGIFNDSGMCFATSVNEMQFEDFSTKPTALFIIIPDEKESRHGIATMMISQLYKKLVDMANSFPEYKLPRTVYFLLDEFANLPKIEKIDSMITVSRSRNVFFALVVQSFSQLNAKYGDDVAATLKGNCPIKIFIGTDDAKTCEEFSKLCGDVSLETTSTSESKQKDSKDGSSKTTSVSTASRPLIYPDELGHLEGGKTGEVIIKILNEFPIRTKATFAWATPMFDKVKASDNYVPSRALNEIEVAYSIVNRNQKVLSKQQPMSGGGGNNPFRPNMASDGRF